MYKAAAAVCALIISAFSVTAPPNWGDFQMGLVNNDRVEWDAPMRDAVQMGDQYKLDRRYIYIDDTLNFASYWTGTGNWSKNSFYKSHGVKPAIVIYMLQRGGDSWSRVCEGMGSKEFMESYFRHIALLADSTRGEQPIYVLEPDVWSYMLQDARENDPKRYTSTGDDWSRIEDNNLDQFCHINDLGIPWLEEFENKASNLPGAIIKTLKMRDPECYAGLLIGFWGFQPSTTTSAGLFTNSSEVISVGARETAKFVKALLGSTPYRGDFAGLEKNGSDLGYWKQIDTLPEKSKYVPAFDWDDRENSDWVKFAKTVSDSTNLPMIGWQIAIGHPGLANIANEYEDTFFPYFFTHTEEYINAGIIGMLAGCANQGKGTMATPPNGKLYTHPDFHPSGTRGDNGWFYEQYAEFNKKRPLVKNSGSKYFTVIAKAVGDTSTVIDLEKYPAWDPAKIYQPVWGVKSYVSYKGRIYEVYQYAGAGSAPDKSPYAFKDYGPPITMGGMVWNPNIYYEPGSTAVHYFNPKAIIDGYGVDWIKVNGVLQKELTDHITIPAISQNCTIEVKFVKGGKEVKLSGESDRKLSAQGLFTLNSRSITVHNSASVEIFSLGGRKIRDAYVQNGSFSTADLTAGTYIVRVSSKGIVRSAKFSVR